MTDQIMHFDAGKLVTRVAMILALGLALAGAWFTIRSYIGNTVAEYLTDDTGIEMSRRAVLLAPGDPFAHWKLGAVAQRNLPADQLGFAITELEKAASLSPNDYRYWMELGATLERAGEVERAERALRRALELAPSYAYPHWYMGNLLLRSERYPEAFEELRRASEADSKFQPQLFNAARGVYRDDVEALKNAVGTASTTRAGFSQYLVGLQKYDDGVALWKSLNEQEKRENREVGEEMVKALIVAKHFHQAAAISNDLVLNPAYTAAEGKFIDGSFEDNITHQTGANFGWQVTSLAQAQIGIDPSLGHDSDRSMRIFFQVRAKLETVDISQLLLVAPDTQYELEFYVKTQKVESAETPAVAIFDATDGTALASSASAPAGSNDWERITLSFKTKARTEAVTLRMVRGSCGADNPCPIFGTLWYDDFTLKTSR